MSANISKSAIQEIASYLEKIQGKKWTKDEIQLCAGNHKHLLAMIERHRVVKNLNYHIRYISKCEPSESDRIIEHFRGNGYAVNEYSREGQSEIVVLY